MKNIILSLSIIFFSLCFQPLQAQEKTFFEKVEELEQQKAVIVEEEKEALKKEVENINQRLEAKKINSEEAVRLKEKAAKIHALNIENRITIIDNQIELLTRTGKVDEPFSGSDKDGENGDSKATFNWRGKDHHYDDRTETDLVIAAGLNNALYEGQGINDSDFKIGGSRFFELGVAWKTRVFQNTNWLRVKYGVSFQFNGLKPTENRYFIEDGDETYLETHPTELDKSKFRMDNLVFPLHFEIGPSRKVETDRTLRFYTEKKLKIGFGGYAGFNIGERQKRKFEENGEDIKQKLKSDYNTNEFIYGLSGYLGWGDAAVYVKYDLNPIFKEPNAELNNISVGLRFDMD